MFSTLEEIKVPIGDKVYTIYKYPFSLINILEGKKDITDEEFSILYATSFNGNLISKFIKGLHRLELLKTTTKSLNYTIISRNISKQEEFEFVINNPNLPWDFNTLSCKIITVEILSLVLNSCYLRWNYQIISKTINNYKMFLEVINRPDIDWDYNYISQLIRSEKYIRLAIKHQEIPWDYSVISSYLRRDTFHFFINNLHLGWELRKILMWSNDIISQIVNNIEKICNRFKDDKSNILYLMRILKFNNNGYCSNDMATVISIYIQNETIEDEMLLELIDRIKHKEKDSVFSFMIEYYEKNVIENIEYTNETYLSKFNSYFSANSSLLVNAKYGIKMYTNDYFRIRKNFVSRFLSVI